MHKRIHILGASGSGTTTLGAHLSKELKAKHLDTDSFFWKKTAIPFSEKESVENRLNQIEREIKGVNDWILSGSLCSWGDPLIKHFTHLIYLWIPWDIRKDRLLKREERRHGANALSPDGSMHKIHTDFMEWASRYDTAGIEQRSRASHYKWIKNLPKEIEIIKLEGAFDEEDLVQKAIEKIGFNKTE